MNLSEVTLSIFSGAYMSTLKYSMLNKPDFGIPAIYIFWHRNMLAGWYLLKDKNAAALVSKSKDGELLTSMLQKWNYNIFRGSSSDGGKEALSKMISFLKENLSSAALTPDGPRGPSEVIKNGVFKTAIETGLPVIPVKILYSSYKQIDKSWDKFKIPYPFSKCKIIFGNKMYVRDRLTDTELLEAKKELSEQM